ncbi:hypothetical protein [Paraburkholderia sp. ZP32-5]|uniref:hypothetical protein n=1 Tax=Paraburkholderia sp. ZP32-5 TaxID=2883245 RepID=UPI001F3CC3FB|nr:hypothetical protein [Paraburkholderia sp. ZP32-5]
MIDLEGIFVISAHATNLSHYENSFRNVNILASHKGDLYNRFHCCSSWATSAVSSTSSFGGLNPNRLFGFFFVRVLRLRVAAFRPIAANPSHVLTPRHDFLYNSGLFRIRARGGRTRESLHAPRCAHYKQEKTHWAQQFFWIDHEDVFRKSP